MRINVQACGGTAFEFKRYTKDLKNENNIIQNRARLACARVHPLGL